MRTTKSLLRATFGAAVLPGLMLGAAFSLPAFAEEPAEDGVRLLAQAPSDERRDSLGLGDMQATGTENQPSEAAPESAGALAEQTEPLAAEEEEAEQGPMLPPGDDMLPTLDQLREAGTVPPEGQATGEAFLPPPVTKVGEEIAQEAGAEILSALGAEVFNRRVNIATPPDTEVAEVIRLLAERADLNFVYAEGVIRGRVTLNLKDVQLGVALKSLLASNGLTLIPDGDNVIRIVPVTAVRGGQAVETRTIYIKLNWVQATALEGTLRGVLGAAAQTAGGIKAHKESNTLIVTDTPPNVALIRDLVAQLDVPDKQVMIEARLVEVLIRAGRNVGSAIAINKPADTSFQLNPVNGAAGTVVEGVASRLIGNTANPNIAFGGVVNILGKQFDVAAALDGLEERRLVNIVAAPRVITLNNQEANIEITRQEPFLEAQQGVTQGVVQATVRFEETGVKLVVLPTISNNGFVRMQLKPEQKIRSSDFPTPQGPVPIIDTRTALTNVIVKDEDTVVLGGLRQIDNIGTRSMFPWLGNAPILGHFFRTSLDQHTKNDLMLFVTPRIVKNTDMAPAEIYKHSRLEANWDLPDYFFDDSVLIREGRHRGELDHDPKNYFKREEKLPSLTGSAGASYEKP